jgi:hypothetical protein
LRDIILDLRKDSLPALRKERFSGQLTVIKGLDPSGYPGKVYAWSFARGFKQLVSTSRIIRATVCALDLRRAPRRRGRHLGKFGIRQVTLQMPCWRDTFEMASFSRITLLLGCFSPLTSRAIECFPRVALLHSPFSSQ